MEQQPKEFFLFKTCDINHGVQRYVYNIFDNEILLNEMFQRYLKDLLDILYMRVTYENCYLLQYLICGLFTTFGPEITDKYLDFVYKSLHPILDFKLFLTTRQNVAILLQDVLQIKVFTMEEMNDKYIYMCNHIQALAILSANDYWIYAFVEKITLNKLPP
jgi:hypothetical protein